MLATWRTSKGWTQSDLGSRLGLTKGHVSRLETGAERISAEQAVAIDRLSEGAVPVAGLRPDLHDVRVLRPGDQVVAAGEGAS